MERAQSEMADMQRQVGALPAGLVHAALLPRSLLAHSPTCSHPLLACPPQMDQRFEAAQREAQQAGSSGSGVQGQQLVGPGGPCGYRWQRSEHKEGPGEAI